MKKLQKPKFSVEEVISTLKTSMLEGDLKQKLIQAEKEFLQKEKLYFEKANFKKFYELLKSDKVDDLSILELKSLYEKMRSKSGSNNSHAEIKSLAQNNICPICGIGQVTTLDHYLCKSQYGDFVITPINLVPMCSDCNKNKLDAVFSNYTEQLYNPYFDSDPAHIFLKCNAQIENSIFSATYEIIKTDSLSDEEFARLKNHFNKYKLNLLFSSNAVNEFESIKFCITLQKENGDDSLGNFLNTMLQSCEQQDINSWKSAFYRELVSNKSKL